MGPVATFFGIATAVVVTLGFLASRRDFGLSAAASIVLALGWGAGQISERLVGWSLTPDSYAMIDVISGIAMAMLYARSESRWILALAFVFTTQSALHLAYQAQGLVPGGIYIYLAGLNALYAVSLILVAFGGRSAADVLADLGRRGLRWMRDRHPSGRPAAVRRHGCGL